jgi:acyl-coenzyme A thioesterase PaaI-like protein
VALNKGDLDESLPAINEDPIDHGCFGCGNGNSQGLRLRFRPLPKRGVWARFTPSELHQGYLAMTHGGILSTILDEAMSWAITHEGDLGVTARMSLSFRNAAYVGETLIVIAHVRNRRGRLIDADAVLLRQRDDLLVAEAEGRFMRVTPEQAAAWRDAYSAADSPTAFGRAAERNASAKRPA